MRFRALIIVTPKTGISDPEGTTIKNAAAQLGFEGLVKVTAGRAFLIELEAPSPEDAEGLLKAMGDRLLANPVIQDFEIGELEAI